MCQTLLPALRWQEGGGVASSETAIESKKNFQLVCRVRNALPLASFALALLVNVAWIGFLGYWLVRLMYN
jgi:hypothetical protein